MATETIKVNGNKLIEKIGMDDAYAILDVIGIDLTNVSDRETIDDQVEWQCGVEKIWWPIRGRQLNLTDLYAVRWTDTEEAGIDDVTIVEIVDSEQDAIDLGQWLRSIAAICGSSNGNVR